MTLYQLDESILGEFLLQDGMPGPMVVIYDLLATGVLVPVEPDYEAASKKAHDFNHKAERYRLEHPIQANSPYDRLLMDMTVLREVVDAAMGIGETL